MRFLKIIFGILLLIAPICLSTVDATDTAFMMTPIGAVSVINEDVDFAFYNFKWFTEDGRVEYLFNADNAAKLYAGIYVIQIDFFGNDMSTEGVLTVLLPLMLILFILLMFVPGSTFAFVGDALLIGSVIMSLAAFFTYLDRIGGFYDFNFPIYAIVAGIFAIISVSLSIKESKSGGKRRRRR